MPVIPRALISAAASIALAACSSQAAEPPAGFTRLSDVAPDIVQEIRYHGDHNFVGRPVTGYDAPECWLTDEAAQALVQVQAVVKDEGYSLKVYDCYRPQRAVTDFVEWAKDPDDDVTRGEFYPRLAKDQLFPLGADRCQEWAQPWVDGRCHSCAARVERQSEMGRGRSRR